MGQGVFTINFIVLFLEATKGLKADNFSAKHLDTCLNIVR